MPCRLDDTNDILNTSEQPEKQKKKHTATGYAVSFFAKITVTALALWVLLTWVAGVFVCHDNSAYPMIKDGDLCFTYRLDDLRQGDEIVYKVDGNVRFGRIIAFGGETVDILNEYISVGGYGLFEDVLYPTTSEGAQITFPYTVSENCVSNC